MPKLVDLSGRQFHRLTVIDMSHRRHRRDTTGTHIYWRCMCECGTITTVAAQSLRRGSTKSCGCLRSESNIKRLTKHGMSKTSIYYIWSHINERCSNPNMERYPSYGGRGITVCERWRKFDGFLTDMGSTWFPGASIERKEVNGNYEPNNCIWIARGEQSKNRQNSIIIDSPWGQLNAIYVAKRLGLSPGTFYWRIKHWPKDRWLEPPKRT